MATVVKLSKVFKLLVVETRNCCVCASAFPSVSQTISRFLPEIPCAVQVVHVTAEEVLSILRWETKHQNFVELEALSS
ncbi:unnamed protein product [Sphagnum tenellum]